jgi:hypothetical protein
MSRTGTLLVVYGGIHFTFDNEPSQQVCARVVDFIVEHFMMPN